MEDRFSGCRNIVSVMHDTQTDCPVLGVSAGHGTGRTGSVDVKAVEVDACSWDKVDSDSELREIHGAVVVARWIISPRDVCRRNPSTVRTVFVKLAEARAQLGDEET